MRQRCENCPTKADCVAAFGIYWSDKSGGGVGCEHPFAYKRDAGVQERRARMELELAETGRR